MKRACTSNPPVSSCEVSGYLMALAKRLWTKGNDSWKDQRLDEALIYAAACMAAAREASDARIRRRLHAAHLAEMEAKGLKLRRTGRVYFEEYGTSGIAYTWLDPTPTLFAMSDDDLISALGLSAYYGGPGLPFVDPAWVRRRNTRGALVTQRFGLDI